MLSNTLKELKRYGYNRQETAIPKRDNRTFRKKNYYGKNLNHSILEYVTIEECNFELAAITGSIYRHCSFVNNLLKEADFEFCEFAECDFWSKDPINCSYNNSNFISSNFYNIIFDACTFTSAYFENCHFRGGKISYSTLENSIFKNCFFENVDLSKLNMDYIELDNPHMNNVVLPMSQIPFMYGCLKYLLETDHNVKISKGKNRSMTPQEYFEKVIPLMKRHFEDTKQFFPLANIHLALGEYNDATHVLKEGVSISVENKDFRMLKYYCYLIAKSGYFRPDALHMFYNNICRLSPQGEGTLNEQRNYTRHIGEIKSILFNRNPMPSLRLTMRTNIISQNVEKLSHVLEAIFKISKTDIGYGTNQIEMLVSENSPLIIEVHLNGTEESLMTVLLAFSKLLDIEDKIYGLLPIMETDISSIQMLFQMANDFDAKLKELSVMLVMAEYYLENCEKKSNVCYYFNSQVEERALMLKYNGGEM